SPVAGPGPRQPAAGTCRGPFLGVSWPAYGCRAVARTMADEEGKGAGLATRLALALGLARDAGGKRLARPFVRRYGRYTSLQFSRKQTQSRMLTADPDALLIDYTRT